MQGRSLRLWDDRALSEPTQHNPVKGTRWMAAQPLSKQTKRRGLSPSHWMVIGWYMDAKKGRLNIDPKPKSSDSEKITINLGLIDLGQIDLLVQEGFYSNRTDFIRTAIRNQLLSHAEAVRQTIARKTLVLGLQAFSRRDLESVRKAGSKLRIHGLGLVRIASDVSPALARDTIESVEVLGALHASPAVKAALADRII
jgi:Arc/MetJ-type ribon-helix-helix transcriptional regulator